MPSSLWNDLHTKDLTSPKLNSSSPHQTSDSVFLILDPAVAAAAAKSLQLCPTLCDPIDGSAPGSPVPGILQARTLEWVAISFSNSWMWKVKVRKKVKVLSRVRLSATPWTAAFQAPLSMEFSRQEYWSGCHCLSSAFSCWKIISKNLFSQCSISIKVRKYGHWKKINFL